MAGHDKSSSENDRIAPSTALVRGGLITALAAVLFLLLLLLIAR